MAIKRGSKVDPSFSAASMTDLIFLLLLFLMISTTLVNTNALKVDLPQGSNQVTDKTMARLSVTKNLSYFIDEQPVHFENIEMKLREKLAGIDRPTVMLIIDKSVTVEELARIMNIAKRNNYVLLMMTQP